MMNKRQQRKFNEFLNKKFISRDGCYFKVIGYTDCNDVDIEFEDGHKAKTSTFNIRNRYVKRDKPFTEIIKDRELYSTDGYKYEVIQFNTHRDVDIRFEDGYETKVPRYLILKERVTRINEKPSIRELAIRKFMNEKFESVDGVKFKIIKYNNINDISIKFEDGYIINTTKRDITNNKIKRNEKVEIKKDKTSYSLKIILDNEILGYYDPRIKKFFKA